MGEAAEVAGVEVEVEVGTEDSVTDVRMPQLPVESRPRALWRLLPRLMLDL